MVSSPTPELVSVESHLFPARGALASVAGPGANSPRVCFSSLSLGETTRPLCSPPSPHSCLENPAHGRRPSGPAARPIGGLASEPCFCLPPQLQCPYPQEATLSISDAASLTPPVFSSRWSGLVFWNGSASNSSFTVYVLI